jgi:stage II sporulation protein E
MLKEMFKFHNCIIYILTFLVSIVQIKNEILPFGLAILAACMGSTVPIFMVYLTSFISTGIFHGLSGLASFFYTSLIFFLLVFMFKPKVSLDDRNEVFKVGSRLFIASFIYNLIKNIRGVFLIYDLFLGVIIAALTYVFYKIFVNGIVVIRDFKEKRAFTVEEIIAASIILAVAISVFNNITIFSLSISNILIIFIVMCLGWKNGMLVGGTSGISIGLALTLIGNFNLLQLAVFAVAGILAGALNRFGKIGVVIGFVLGNAILTYLANGNTATIIYFREIFIAALGLLLVPSKFKIKIEDLFEKDKLLENVGERRFNYYEDVKEKLNAVVNTISDMNNNFSLKNNSIQELKEEIYINNFLDSFEEYQENIFYDDVINNEDLVLDIFNCLKEEDIITENMVVNIFKKYNNYILLRDQKIKDDLQELIKIANRTYRELQTRVIKEETKREEAKKLRTEIKTVTNIINKVADDVKQNNKFENKEKELMILLKGKGYNVNSVQVKQCENGKYIR